MNKQSKERANINLIVVVLIAFLTVIAFANVDILVNQLNNEVYNHYGFENYFYKTTIYGAFNETVFQKYQVPVYGNLHGGYKKVVTEMEPRFIGYADNGESVPNPVFPPDELGAYELCGLPWVSEPWMDKDVKDLKRFSKIKMTHFDMIPENFVDSLLYKLEKDYGENGKIRKGIFTKALADVVPWTDYIHVIVPPTSISKGLVVMFHTNGGTLCYMDVVLEPLEALKGTLHIKTVTESGMLIDSHEVKLEEGSSTTYTRL